MRPMIQHGDGRSQVDGSLWMDVYRTKRKTSFLTERSFSEAAAVIDFFGCLSRKLGTESVCRKDLIAAIVGHFG